MIRRGIGLVLAVLIGLAWVSSATAQDARSVPERTLEIRRYQHRQTEFAEGLFGEHAWRITWWIRTNEGARQILEIGSNGLCEWWIGGEQSFAYRLAADTLHVSLHNSEGEPQPVASVLLIKAGNVIRVHYLDDSQPDREMAPIGGAPGGESYLEGIWKTLQPGPVERTEEFRADGTLIMRTKRDLGSCRVENGLLSIDFAELDQPPSRAVHIAGQILVLSAPPWTDRRFRRIE